MHHTFMHAHTPTHNLWLWPKRPPLAFPVAKMSVGEMSGPKSPRPKSPRPKCPTLTVMYQVKYSTVVHIKVPIINGRMLGLHFFKNLLQAINAAFNLYINIKVPIINGRMLGLHFFKNLLQAINAAFNL